MFEAVFTCFSSYLGPASAAPQPLGRLCRPLAGGHDPPPATALAGPLPGWRWPQDFMEALVRWARVLAWVPGLAEVSWAELALDYEAFVGRALPSFPDHQLRRMRLLLGERPQVLRKAVGLTERHLAAETLLSGAPLGRCRSLLPLGGPVCAKLSVRPFFAARHEVMLQLIRLATHWRVSWVRRLRAPACMRPPPGDRFLMDHFPHPLDPPPPLLPCARRPPRAPPRSVPLAAPQHSRPPRASNGTQGALCLEHGATSCARCRSLGWGIGRCCRASHKGHTDPAAGSRCPRAPPRVAPRRQVLVPEDRRAGAAALSSWLGRAHPASQAPGLGPPGSLRCAAPPRTLAPTPPRHWGQTTPGPRSARRLTSWLTGGSR